MFKNRMTKLHETELNALISMYGKSKTRNPGRDVITFFCDFFVHVLLSLSNISRGVRYLKVSFRAKVLSSIICLDI